jgi:uncharacterized membrane protein
MENSNRQRCRRDTSTSSKTPTVFDTMVTLKSNDISKSNGANLAADDCVGEANVESITPRSPRELNELVSQQLVVDMTDEDMDPLEWSVRKLIPIPAHYYWDVIRSPSEEDLIRPAVKRWHRMIAAFDIAYRWTDRSIAQPLAATIGLTDSRFGHVADYMSEEDWARSMRHVNQRRQSETNEMKNRETEFSTEENMDII